MVGSFTDIIKELQESASRKESSDLVSALKQKAKNEPSNALFYAKEYINFIPEGERVDLLKEAFKKDVVTGLQFADKYMGLIPENQRTALLKESVGKYFANALSDADKYMDFIPKAERAGLLKEFVNKASDGGLSQANKYIGFIPENERAGMIKNVIDKSPFSALANAKNYMDFIPENQRAGLIKEAIKKDPTTALQHAKDYINFIPENQRAELLKEAVKNRPGMALMDAKDYMDFIPENQRAGLIKEAIKKDPVDAFGSVKDYMGYIPESDRRPLLELAAQERMASLNGIRKDNLDNEYARKYLSPEAIENLAETHEKKLKALNTGELLNRNHDLPTEQRFAPIKDYDSKQLFEQIAFGRQEMYTSTYLHVFDRLAGNLQTEKKNIYDIADPKHAGSDVVVLLESATSYNRIDKAIQLIPKEKWGDVLTKFGEKINDGNMSHAVSLAEIMQKMPDKDIKQQMEKFIQEQYNKAPEGKIKDSYGVLASHYNQISGSKKIELKNPEKYNLPAITEIPNKDLLGKDGIHRQLLAFSDDNDGQYSYGQFLKKYKGNDKYKIEDKGDFVKITPVGASDTKMEIYANKPDKSPDAIIKSIGGDKATVKDVEFDMVIHRGHSFNLDSTMKYFSSSNALMFVGSCGGYHNIEELLKIAPKGQIISTKEMGTALVNDPLLYDINEHIRKGEKIEWKKEQDFLNNLGNKSIEGYVLPHKNTAMLMQKKINEMDEQRSAEHEKVSLIHSKAGREIAVLSQAGVIQTADNKSAYNNVPGMSSGIQLGA